MGGEALRAQAGAGKTGKEAQGTRTGQAARGNAIQEVAERGGGGEGSTAAEEGVGIAAAERRERDRGDEKTGRGLPMARTDKAKHGAADEQVKVIGSPQNSNSKHPSNPMPNDILVREASGLVQSLPFKVSNRVGGKEVTNKAKDDASTVKTAPDRLTAKTIEFRVGEKVMAMRQKENRNAFANEEMEGMVSEGPNIVSCAEMLCCKTTGEACDQVVQHSHDGISED
jgi:hypothetical protein